MNDFEQSAGPETIDAKCLETFPEWLRSLASDATALSAVVGDAGESPVARRYAAASINYIFKSLDLIPDGIEDLGYLDDAFVLRVAAALTLEQVNEYSEPAERVEPAPVEAESGAANSSEQVQSCQTGQMTDGTDTAEHAATAGADAATEGAGAGAAQPTDASDAGHEDDEAVTAEPVGEAQPPSDALAAQTVMNDAPAVQTSAFADAFPGGGAADEADAPSGATEADAAQVDVVDVVDAPPKSAAPEPSAEGRSSASPIVKGLAVDSQLIEALLGPDDFERLRNYVATLADRPARGRTVTEILDDESVQRDFQNEVAGWATSYEAPTFSKDEKNLVKLRSFLSAKLP